MNTPELLDLIAVRDSMVATHKDFKSGLEQVYHSSINQPHTGQVSVIPYTNESGVTNWSAKLEGADITNAKAFLNEVKGTGGGGGTGRAPAPSVNPNNPLQLDLPNRP